MMGTNAELYNADFYAWCLATAALIREGKWYDIDREALADRTQRRELRQSRFSMTASGPTSSLRI